MKRVIPEKRKDNASVLPRSSGPIKRPGPVDVLSGRGGRINIHLGNVKFRDIVSEYKNQYVDVRTKKVDKANIAADIVAFIRSKGGRFLKQETTGSFDWYEIGDKQAIRKTAQALREDASELRCQALDSNLNAKDEAIKETTLMEEVVNSNAMVARSDQNVDVTSDSLKHSFTEVFGQKFYRPSLTEKKDEEGNGILHSRVSSIGSISDFSTSTKDRLYIKIHPSAGRVEKGKRVDSDNVFSMSDNNNNAGFKEESEPNINERNSIVGEVLVPNQDYRYRSSLLLSAITMPDVAFDDFPEEEQSDNEFHQQRRSTNAVNDKSQVGENLYFRTIGTRSTTISNKISFPDTFTNGGERWPPSATRLDLVTSTASLMDISIEVSITSSIKSLSNSVITNISKTFSTMEL